MDQGLKQRITGALVLVAAAVIFLPMLLSGQDETVTVEVDVPEPSVIQTQPIQAVVPLEMPEPDPVPELDVPPLPSEITPAAEPPPVQVTPQPVIAEPVPAPVVAPVTASAPDGDWVIQLVSLSDAGKAAELAARLGGEGYNAYTRAVVVNGNRLVRVYAGPVLDRTAAARLRDELERRHGLKGLVVAFDDSSRPQP